MTTAEKYRDQRIYCLDEARRTLALGRQTRDKFWLDVSREWLKNAAIWRNVEGTERALVGRGRR